MNPNDYIEKAKHALLTGQPNLAMLYMKRGLVEMRRLRPDPFEGVRDAFNTLAAAFASLGEAAGRVALIIEEAFRPLVEGVRNDYVLA